MKKTLIIIILIFIMSLCGCNVTSKGELMLLEEAYEAGYINDEQLKSIAFYYQGTRESGFEPIVKNPKKISLINEQRIKKLYADKYLDFSIFSMFTVEILDYYGTYNECVALDITDNIYLYDLVIEDEYKIGDVIFYNYCIRDIMVAKLGNKGK